mgnify:CR=1 FL=1
MLGISGNLNAEYRTFNLNKINIEDEGMEDLEKFNLAYKIDNSKCSLYEVAKKIPYYSQINNANDETKIKDNKNTVFKIDLYFRGVIENMKTKNIKSMIMELGALSSNNFIILTKIKSIKSRWKKEQLVNLALDIMKNLINIDE